MLPHNPRPPAPASGVDGERVGRHRRPETPETLTGDTTVSARSARHRAGAYPSFGSSRGIPGVTRASRPRTARHARPADRPAAATTRAGAHRAPGTRPVEHWLKAARSRPQIMLAALVAAGLLLTAAPTIPQRDGAATSVMSVAAQAVAARVTDTEPAPATTTAKAAPRPVTPKPEATRVTAPPRQPRTTRPQPSAEARPAGLDLPRGDGPARSLVTTGSRTVMLSFDDGPDPSETPKVLEILAQHRVRAVFCLVGTQATAHPDLVRRISDAGHVLCNHTWNHDLKIGKKKPDEIQADLARTSAAIRAAAPGAAIPYFRAPGGNFTDRLVRVAYADGMTSLYWDVDPRDWFHPAGESDADRVKRVVAEVKKNTRPGSIILSHDFNQPATTEAYRQLLPWLTATFQVGVPGRAPAPGATPPPLPATPVSSAPTPSAPATGTAPATPSSSAPGAPASSAAPAGEAGGEVAAGEAGGEAAGEAAAGEPGGEAAAGVTPSASAGTR